jgi:hypothetical protein
MRLRCRCDRDHLDLAGPGPSPVGRRQRHQRRHRADRPVRRQDHRVRRQAADQRLDLPIRRTRHRAGRRLRRQDHPGRSRGRRPDAAACCWDSGVVRQAAGRQAVRRHLGHRGLAVRLAAGQPDADRPARWRDCRA